MKKQPNGLCRVLWDTWDEFWQKTNICGISNAGNARNSVVRRIIWIIIFCVSTGFTIWGVKDVIEEYREYPVDTLVAVKHLDRVRLNNMVYNIFQPLPTYNYYIGHAEAVRISI